MQQTKQPLRTAIRYRYLDMLDWIEHQNISIIGAALVLMAIVSGSVLVGRVRSDARAAAVPTAQLPIVIIASPIPVQPPTAVPPIQVAAVAPAQRWVTAFAAPDGVVLGPIPAPDASAIEARYGDGWHMIQWNGGPAWIRASELGLNIADMSPARVVYVPVQSPPAPAYAAPVVVAAPTPATVYNVVNERQTNIQNRLIAIPTIAPMEMTDANAEWARQQYAAEHPEAGR